MQSEKNRTTLRQNSSIGLTSRNDGVNLHRFAASGHDLTFAVVAAIAPGRFGRKYFPPFIFVL
jgi:hypothetical protein